MNTLQHLGIDISKDSLVACLKVLGSKDRESTFANDDQGVDSLLAFLGGDATDVRVVMEATGRFHRLVERRLVEAGAQVTVLNPKRARSLAIGLGCLDKNDTVDARILARAAELLEHEDTGLRTLAHEQLRDLSRLIDAMTRDRTIYKKRLSGLGPSAPAREVIEATLRDLALRIRQAKKLFTSLLKQEPELQRRFELAMSKKDVGAETARVVTCELPSDLSKYRVDQLCAYAAVVPRRNQSGNHEGKQYVGKCGNKHLRTGIYMAASRSVFISKTNEDLYLRLRAKGKSHKQAMVAVIHRVLRVLATVLKRGTPWTPEPPQRNETPVLAAGTP
jgi:transposase